MSSDRNMSLAEIMSAARREEFSAAQGASRDTVELRAKSTMGGAYDFNSLAGPPYYWLPNSDQGYLDPFPDSLDIAEMMVLEGDAYIKERAKGELALYKSRHIAVGTAWTLAFFTRGPCHQVRFDVYVPTPRHQSSAVVEAFNRMGNVVANARENNLPGGPSHFKIELNARTGDTIHGFRISVSGNYGCEDYYIDDIMVQ